MRATPSVVGTQLLAAFLGGCATSGSTLMIGAATPAISPDEVVVLMEFPAAYETVALLKSEDGGANFNSKAKTQELCLMDLRKRAAAVGANGR